ncbi:MAG: hypothetical protein V4683_06280 [Bacteroidota bacterium]
MNNQATFDKAVEFLIKIGIPVRFESLDKPTFLPGLFIDKGTIILDLEKLKYPGDLLHEAGHIAIVPAAERLSISEADIALRKDRESEEMMAIAWSYAVCVEIDINPSFIFHDEGYNKGGSSIAANFKEERYFGVPMLQWVGMALEKSQALILDKPAYPKMLQWLRD